MDHIDRVLTRKGKFSQDTKPGFFNPRCIVDS